MLQSFFSDIVYIYHLPLFCVLEKVNVEVEQEKCLRDVFPPE